MNKEEILIALKEIQARYCIPASEQNYTDKDYACMQYEKLIIHLQKRLDRLNNIINELENDLKKRKHTYTNMNGSINGVAVGCFTYVLKKLQELKDSDKNDN